MPAPVDWYIYGKMDSIAALGATEPVECATARDGQDVDVGEIQIQPGHRLCGKVTLSDGASLADAMRVTISTVRAWDSQTAVIGRDGSFEFANLPAGKYEIFTSVRGYQMHGNPRVMETTIDRDTDDYAIVLDRSTAR